MKRWVKITLVSSMVFSIGAAGYVYYLYHSVTSNASKIYEPVNMEQSDPHEKKISIQQKEPFSMLVLGIDETESDAGRSDTLVLLTVNPVHNSVLMFSIPRDTLTEIVGHGKEDKINHAFAFGGPEMSINTVEKFLDVPIDYYAKVNLDGFRKIIDTLGGVNVYNKFSFSYGGHSFPQGKIHLDGESAIWFSKMRYEDPRGDLGRNERQRQILKSVLQKVSSPVILTKLGVIIDHLGSSVKTNLTLDEIKNISSEYRSVTEKIEIIEINGTGKTIDGVYYYIVNQEERERIQSEVKKQLDVN